MTSLGPVRSASGSIQEPISRAFGLYLAIGLASVGVSVYFVFAAIVGQLTVQEAYLGVLLLPAGLFGLVLLGARLEGRALRDYGFGLREPARVTLVFASLLVGLFTTLRIDAGFFFGFGRVLPLSPLVYGFLLLSAPVVALGNVGLFFGLVERNVARATSLRTSILVSAAFYAACSTNLTALATLGVANSVTYLLTTAAVNFAIGIAVGFYVYKARWGLLGPFTFLAGVSALNVVLPVGVTFPTWETDFATSMLAAAVIVLVTGLGLEEPRSQARKYLGEVARVPRRRARPLLHDPTAFRQTLVAAAVVGVAVVSFSYGLPTVLGTSHPLLAIATGSMVPALERGTLVVVGHAAPGAITVGTIIAFSVGCLPSPTVHRVIKVVSKGPNWVFQTKGDANPSQDPCTVPYSAVLGVVVGVVPYVGYLILDPLFAGAIVLLAIIVPMLWRGRRA
jgi:signal peptidase I